MKILVACEYSGTVRRAFRALGHDAWSCDILPADDNSPHHLQGDVLQFLNQGWDLMIAHPPCTHLAVSGARWFKHKQKEQKEAIDFFMALVNAPIPKIAVENPVCIMSTQYRKPDQVIHPWQFGHPERKATCLWLKDLPPLVPTNVVKEEMEQLPRNKQHRIHLIPPGKDRWKIRSLTYEGIAKAMAEQWTKEE